MSEDTIDDSVLSRVLDPGLTRLAAQLGSITALTVAERRTVHAAAAAALRDTVRLRTNRVLILEMHAARIGGKLTATDPRGRWAEWTALASREEFWDGLGTNYPTLLPRLRTLVDNRCAAALSMARRFAADRAGLGVLLTVPGSAEPAPDLGELVGVEFGMGDSHRGGNTVAILTCTGGRVVYKPRSVAVDAALTGFLARVLPDEPAATRIAVPDVVCRDGYGWAAHVTHRYCDGDAQLRSFYRGLGHWLAVMRLLGGSDLHAENVVAVGPVPMVVDCETLFIPVLPARESGYGLAVDRAGVLVGDSVLGTGLLPGRGLALGWRGVDQSAIGSLPGQQPTTKLPIILDGATDEARFGYAEVQIPMAANHPSPNPVLGRYWDQMVNGFTELTEHLQGLDRAGDLEDLLATFADVPIRVVPRSTECYAELARMLWHPQSLHDEPPARARAVDLLARQARNVSGRPTEPVVIDAEVADLLEGDVPFFSTTPSRGTVSAPRGTTWGSPRDLAAAALRRWRAADFAVERQVIRCALVSAYLNEGWMLDIKRLRPSGINRHGLDRRRRTLAAGIVQGVADAAIRAEDGTVTWIAPVLDPTGWAVLSLGLDVYGGAAGIAILLAGYLREMRHDRADPVPGLPGLIDDVVRTMRLAETQWAKDRAAISNRRALPAGGYLGVGSRIWGWLALYRLGVVPRVEALDRACALMAELPEALDTDPSLDVVRGMSGAVVPLLRLHEATGNPEALRLAGDIGKRLVAAAHVRDDGTAWWANPGFPDGLGGLAHGATGIGWALSRLAAATGDKEAGTMADAAFAYEETLYDWDRGGWLDLRGIDTVAAAWCHGGGGVGIVAADRLRHPLPGQAVDDELCRQVLHRAAVASRATGLGWNHTLCHGDLGAWEVMDIAIAAGLGPPTVDRERLDAHVIGSIEQHGPISGFARETFVPGLLPGLGGVAYQLLRMHPDCTLPSVLLPDPGPASLL